MRCTNSCFRTAGFQTQRFVPEIQAVPAQRAHGLLHPDIYFGMGLFQGDTVLFGVFLGDKLQPEVIVEVQIQQGAVHVKQDGVDGFPVNHDICTLLYSYVV